MKIKNEDYKDKKFSEKEMKFIKELLKIGKYYNLSRKIIKNTPHNRLPNRKIYNNLFTDYDN